MTYSSPRPGPAHRFTRTLRRIAAALVLLACLSASTAHAGWWDAATEARESTLAEIRRSPEKWRDVPVLLRLAYASRGERTNPYFTQFSAERWRPVTVTARRTQSEIERGVEAEYRRIFVRRGGPDDLRLPNLRPGRKMLVRAVVRDVVAGEPWFEVISFTLDGDPLTTEERTRVKEADRFLSRANPAAAQKLYRGVLDRRKLDAGDRAAILRKMGVALHDLKRGPDALAAFREALVLAPDHVDTRTRIASLEERLARTPAVPAATDSPAADPRKPGLPTHAGRAAPTTPQPEKPLYLPGGRPRLAPPSGLAPEKGAIEKDATEKDAAGGATPRQKPGTDRTAEESRKPAPTVTRRPTPTPLPKPGVNVPATDPKPAIGKRPAPDETEEEEEIPPPVPPRPGLSGPK